MIKDYYVLKCTNLDTQKVDFEAKIGSFLTFTLIIKCLCYNVQKH